VIQRLQVLAHIWCDSLLVILLLLGLHVLKEVLESIGLHILGEADQTRVVLNLATTSFAGVSLRILLLDFPLQLEDAVGARELAVQDGQQDEVEIGGRRESRPKEFVILDHLTVTEGRIQDFEYLRLLVDAVGLREILALVQPVVTLLDLNISLARSSRLLLLNA